MSYEQRTNTTVLIAEHRVHIAHMSIEKNVALAPLTTIKLGGSAQHFTSIASVDELIEALQFARSEGLAVHILGGGSNTIFSDAGFAGLVIHVGLTGVTIDEGGRVTAAAGENWDELVRQTIGQGLAGFETLSGIPGLVGATPMQNVGAYGQEVAQTITQVKALDRETLEEVSFTNEECQFEYRGSRFKYQDKEKYVITEVTYQLRPNGEPTVTYPQLIEALSDHEITAGVAGLAEVRRVVLGLRSKKSMIVDPADPHSRSCGSFFVNPVLNQTELTTLQETMQTDDVPTFVDDEGGTARVPAAWLIEQAGFTKGERRGGVGISANHPLALVNYEGTTTELLALAEEVRQGVEKKTGLSLTREPVVV